MNEEEEQLNINTNVEDNKTIGYDHDSLDGPSGDSEGNAEYYLMKP